MYLRWMGDKMWAFGPAQAAVAGHLTTLEKWPRMQVESEPEAIGGVGN